MTTRHELRHVGGSVPPSRESLDGGDARSQASSSDCATRNRLASVINALNPVTGRTTMAVRMLPPPAVVLGVRGDVEAPQQRRAVHTR